MTLETKAIDPANSREIRDAFDEFLRTFDAFRHDNDERLAQIEKRGGDPVTEEKVDRINRALDEQKRALDELQLSAARPAAGGEFKAAPDARAREQKAAFERYVRKGDASGYAALEVKALSVTDDGGYIVPDETEATIGRVLAKASPIRAIATVRQIGSSVYRKPVTTAGAESGWVGEDDPREETDAPALTVVEFPTMELYAMPAATQMLLDDSQINIERWLADEVQTVFAEQEGYAFVRGNGTTQPKGFLSYTNVADGSWEWTKLGYVASGADGAFASSDPADKLLDLAYAPKQAYRAGGRWVMNRKTEAAIRKFKDSDHNYIWQPGAAAGQPATIFGYPVTEVEDMPDIASNTFSIAFGDFARGYLIVDRVGVRVLRDPYSAKPYVLFYTTKRVGGGVQNFEAIKLMKFAAS